jgi:type I restriction-modification system DNA methylase subunit
MNKNLSADKKKAIRERGEVFTPPALVNQMMDKLPPEAFIDPTETFCDNSCGTGNFLIEVLRRKMAHGIDHLTAIETIFGCEISQSNVNICRQRLSLGSTDEKIWQILKLSIVCADALDEEHPGWEPVGYYWDKLT